MNTFEKLINELNEKLATVNNRVNEMKEQRRNLEGEKSTLKRKYDDHIIASSLGMTSSMTAKDAAKLKDEMDAVNKKLVAIEDSIDTIEKFAKQKLVEYLPEIENRCGEAIQEHMNALDEATLDLRRKRAEYMIFVAGLNDHTRQAQAIQSEFDSICNRLGVANRLTLHVPTLNMLSTYAGADKALGILSNEVQLAYNTGSLPAWIQHYAATSELVTDTEAHQKRLNK